MVFGQKSAEDRDSGRSDDKHDNKLILSWEFNMMVQMALTEHEESETFSVDSFGRDKSHTYPFCTIPE